MRSVTLTLQNNLKYMMTVWSDMYNECVDIDNTYWKSGASTWISGKGDTDAVTVNTKLTKSQFLAGISFVETVMKFFSNQSVTSADYLTTIAGLKYGNTSGATGVPESVEAIGSRMKEVALKSLTMYDDAINNSIYYNENSISTAFSSLSSSIIVYGADMTKQEMVDAITLLGQWINLLENDTVTQGYYSSTVAKWLRIESQ